MNYKHLLQQISDLENARHLENLKLVEEKTKSNRTQQELTNALKEIDFEIRREKDLKDKIESQIKQNMEAEKTERQLKQALHEIKKEEEIFLEHDKIRVSKLNDQINSSERLNSWLSSSKSSIHQVSKIPDLNFLKESIKKYQDQKTSLMNDLYVPCANTNPNSNQNSDQISDSSKNERIGGLQDELLSLQLERQKKLEELSKSNNSRKLIIDQCSEEIDQYKRNYFELEELLITFERLKEDKVCGECVEEQQ
eukprot:gene12220-5806_t